MKVQNWIFEVTADRYNQASPELIMQEHERQFDNEMERNSQNETRNDCQVEGEKSWRTIVLYKKEKKESDLEKQLFFLKTGRVTERKRHDFLFLFSKQMGIWQALYRFPTCQHNENKANGLTWLSSLGWGASMLGIDVRTSRMLPTSPASTPGQCFGHWKSGVCFLRSHGCIPTTELLLSVLSC